MQDDAVGTADPPDLAPRTSHVTPVLGRYFQRTWSHGERHRLIDVDGRSYLDFANGIAVAGLGHGHPRVVEAVEAQLHRLMSPVHALGHHETMTRHAELLAATFPDPLDTVFFLNSGSEAVEGALKMARRVSGRPGIIAFQGGFHGRTFGAASVTTSNVNYRAGYEPLLPGVYFAPYPVTYRDHAGDEAAATERSLRELDRLLAQVVPPAAVGAFLIEPIRGEGGYDPAPLEFLRELRRLADRHGILLIADEVQSGFGRTGSMWASERAGIVPDVVCVAKAVANGLPLSAIVSSRDLQVRWGTSAHGTTYGGNPLSCAAGIAVLDVIREEGLIANAAARGEELSAGLRRLQAEDERIGDVRGPGLMIGVEFVADRATREPDGPTTDRVVNRAADLGLLVLSCGLDHQVVRWIPPLDVTPAEVSEALELFGEALRTA